MEKGVATGKKPSALFALFVMLEMCSDHCKCSFIVIPKCFTDETCFIMFDSML